MLNDILKSFFRGHAEHLNEATYAIAVSGGPDSMALAHGLLTTFPDTEFHILSVDHDLRAGAAAEIDYVEQWVQDFPNATFQRFVWQGDKPESAVMEAARVERYRLMSEYCLSKDIHHMFTGHHLDDQAETFLIRLAKGSGLDGLAAISPFSSYDRHLALARPLLEVCKGDILDYCAENKISFCDDPSNENERYLRPRLREAREVLEKEGLTNKRLGVLTRRLERARNALSDWSIQASDTCMTIDEEGHFIELDAVLLSTYPEEIRLRVLKQAMEELQSKEGYATRYERIEELYGAFWSAYKGGVDMKKRSLGHCFFSFNSAHKTLRIEKDI